MGNVTQATVEELVAAYASAPYPVPLDCGVQHYAWGDTRFIPDLLGIEGSGSTPHAELWMGDHRDLPAALELSGVRVGLDRLLALAGERVLGRNSTRRFGGRLPYLLKVLAAAQPLSIQVHPTRQQAMDGFARENEAGVPVSAPERCYKDPHHKPELLAALTEFHALCGFRPLSEIAPTLARVPELLPLGSQYEPSPAGLRKLYRYLMGLPQAEVDTVLGPLVGRLRRSHDRRPFREEEPEHWVLRCHDLFSQGGHCDRGLFSIYLLNLMHLRPGDALYLPAGVLHAYLRGAGIEIMASSNNVLRGGLTIKHVDVPQLLETVDFEADQPAILRPVPTQGEHESAYTTPAPEFELRCVSLEAGRACACRASAGAEILVVVETGPGPGVSVETESHRVRLTRGGVCLVPQGLDYRIGATGHAVVYKAMVGD